MLNQCTILTFQETEMVKSKLSSIKEKLQKGADAEINPINACNCGIEQIEKLIRMFN